MQDKDTFIREITKNFSQYLAIAGGGEPFRETWQP